MDINILDNAAQGFEGFDLGVFLVDRVTQSREFLGCYEEGANVLGDRAERRIFRPRSYSSTGPSQ